MSKTLLSSGSQQFASEEVPSTYGYPNGYRLRSITKQAVILWDMFPGACFFNPDYLTRITRGEAALPPNAEGWFAIPRWQNIASTYNAAVEKVLAKISQTGPFHNWREGQLGPERLRRSERTAHDLDILAERQKADILIVPGQFGKRHAGRSVRRAREVYAPNEFGLGAYEVGIMLLTHPERLQHSEDLWPDCAGDEYGVGRFGSAPYFDFLAGQLEFDTGSSGGAVAGCGSASGFLSQ